jgi:hypothetical protein
MGQIPLADRIVLDRCDEGVTENRWYGQPQKLLVPGSIVACDLACAGKRRRQQKARSVAGFSYGVKSFCPFNLRFIM